MITNILPVNDIEDHIENSTCECCPTVEILENGDLIIIHNSFDGRELSKEDLLENN